MAGSRTTVRRIQVLLATAVLLTATPATAAAAEPGHPNPTNEMVTVLVPGGQTIALINSGQIFDDETFEGIPDGIGLVPVAGGRAGRVAQGGPRGPQYVDIYVNFEQSHVPFQFFADFEDSSVQRARLNLETKRIVELEEVLPPSAGFIRFCSAFMAGPEHGFAHYTMLLNEESNDQLVIPPGAPYGADPSIAPNRQAGLAVYLDTRTGKFDDLPGHGRHNHENTVIVPGGWRQQIVSLSSDDTFTTTSSPERPNLSQLYLHSARNEAAFKSDRGTLYGFRVTGTQAGPVDPEDPFNDANDFFEIDLGDHWTGEFIAVPEDVANGTTNELPQDALEDWSNENNVFQFIRVEDIAYDPDSPRTVYFTDTGNSRLWEDESTGRLFRLGSGDPRVPNSRTSNGRVFQMVLNASNPLVVDDFSILADGGSPAVGTNPPIPGNPPMRAPDNLDVGHDSIMVQEDISDAKIWMYSLATRSWAHVATVDQDQNPATTGDPGESSGIVDASRWLGAGWWILDVQSHTNQTATTGRPFTWNEPPGPPVGTTYDKRRENGQLLMMHVPGS
jgi:hypothetical protein